MEHSPPRSSVRSDARSRWCIVVADAAGPEWPLSAEANTQTAPIQYCGLLESTTMLQKALHRAGRISHRMGILVTVAEVHRPHWQQVLWFTRAEHRFVSHSPGRSLITTAAAVLSIAARSPTGLITIIPARCYVQDEWTLSVAINKALSSPSLLIDGIVTLGVVGAQPGVDEDYLVLSATNDRRTTDVAFTARRPIERLARQFVRRGALVATGIYIATASSLAALFYRYWPTMIIGLVRHLDQRYSRGVENTLPPTLAQAIRSVPRQNCNRPSRRTLRALPVPDCGWSSLHSLRAIARIAIPRPTQPHAASLAKVSP
jgi:mannose-1-phosphate guanylyltransferase